jgi:integrase
MWHDRGMVISGRVRIEERAAGRVWVAEYRGASGRTRKVLGPAWVRDSGRRTARGAIVWRAGAGSKPDDLHLTPKEAEAALAALLADERKEGTARVGATGKTFGDALDAWIADGVERRSIGAGTAVNYRVMAGKIMEAIPRTTPLRRVTSERLAAYQDDLLRNGELKRGTIKRRMAVLVGTFRLAVRKGWLATNPMDRVDVIPEPPAAPDFQVLTPTEVERVATAIERIPDSEVPRTGTGTVRVQTLEAMQTLRRRWANMVRLAAYTGMRAGELRELRWRDVDFEGRMIQVVRNLPTSGPQTVKRPKGARGRGVVLIDQARGVLLDIGPGDPEDRVFPGARGGAVKIAAVRDAFYDALVATGLGHKREGPEPMVFHDLRHTFGTIAVRVAPLTSVQAWLGHKDIATTMRYVHHVPQRGDAELVSGAFRSH